MVKLDILCKEYRGSVVAVHHSPNASNSEFIDYIINKEEEILTIDNYIIMADFNINVLRESYVKKKLVNSFKALGLNQLVKEPTRVDSDSQTSQANKSG